MVSRLTCCVPHLRSRSPYDFTNPRATFTKAVRDATEFSYLDRVRLFFLPRKKWLKVNKSDCLSILVLTKPDCKFRRKINCSPIAFVFIV